MIRETIKVIRTLGWTLDKAEIAAGNIPKPMTKLSQKKLKDGITTNGYSPKPFDLTSITLTREHYVRIFLHIFPDSTYIDVLIEPRRNNRNQLS